MLLRLEDDRVKIVRGRNNHLMLPVIKKRLSVAETVEQRVIASDLTEVLATLSSVTREEHEDVPSSVELRWRPGDVQAATSSSSHGSVTAPAT